VGVEAEEGGTAMVVGDAHTRKCPAAVALGRGLDAGMCWDQRSCAGAAGRTKAAAGVVAAAVVEHAVVGLTEKSDRSPLRPLRA